MSSDNPGASEFSKITLTNFMGDSGDAKVRCLTVSLSNSHRAMTEKYRGYMMSFHAQKRLPSVIDGVAWC